MQTLGNPQKISIQHSEHGRSLKSRIFDFIQDIFMLLCTLWQHVFCQVVPMCSSKHSYVPQYTMQQPRIFTVISFVLVVWVLKSSMPLLHRICFGTPNVCGFYQVIKIQHLTYDFLTVREQIGRIRSATHRKE